MGLFGKRRRRQETSLDLYYLDTMNHVDASSGIHVQQNRTSVANANQSSLLLQVQDELWEAVRKARPFRRGFYNEQHPHRLFTRPDILLGATQVSLLSIYLVLLHMIWVRPKYRRYHQQRRNADKKSHSQRGLTTEAVQGIHALEGDANATMAARERVLGIGFDPAEEDKTPDPSEGDKDSDQGTVDEKIIEQTGHLPNSYNTPERSRALQLNASPSALTADSVEREPLHPSQLPQPPASASSPGVVAEDSTPASSLITMSAEKMTQQLQNRQKQWQNFQQNAKAKQAESKQQIQHLKTYLQQKEQQLQSTYASQTSQYQNVASQVEQLQDKLAAQKTNMAVGESSIGVPVSISEAVPPASCDDLRAEVQELERDLLQFQSVAHAKNVEYSTQVQTLQTTLCHHDTTNDVATASVHEEDDTPETSRPPPSTHSETCSPASLHSKQNNKVAVEATTSAFRPVAASTAAPSTTKAPAPVPTKARAIAGYGDLVSEVQMLTKTIQRNRPSEEEAASPANDTAASKDLGPQHYARVLEQHLKERAGECARMEYQLSRLQSQLSDQESEVARLRTNSKAEKATLTAQLRSLEGAHELNQGRIERYQSHNATLLAKNENLVQQVETLQELRLISQEGKKDFDWESKMEALNREYQETNAQLQANLVIQGGQCRELTAKIESLTVELDQCRTNASQAEHASAQRSQMLERQLNEQQEKHHQDTSVQREESAVMAARVESLQQEVTNTKSELELVQSKAAQKEEVLSKELYSLKQELIANKTQFEMHLASKDHQKEEELEKSVEASKALQNCEECRKGMAAEFEAKEKSLTTKIQSLGVHLQREIQNVQTARKHEASLRKELDQSQLEVKTLKENTEARDAASTSKTNALCQKLENETKALQSALYAEESKCEELSTKVEELQESLDECTEELDEFQDEAKSKDIVLCAQVQSLQTELHYATKKHKETLAEMESLSSRVDSLRELNEEKSSALKCLAAEKKSYETALTLRIGALVDDLDSKDNYISELEEKTASLANALESRGIELLQLKSEAEERLKANAEDLNGQIISLQQDLETRERAYTTALCEKDTELKNLEKTLESLQTLIAPLESAMEDLPFSPTASPADNDLVNSVRLFVKKFYSCSQGLEVLLADKTELENRVAAKEAVHQEQLSDMEQSLTDAQKTIAEQSTKLKEQKKLSECFQKESSAQEQAYIYQLEELRGKLAVQPDSLRCKLSETETRCDDLATMVDALTMEVNAHNERNTLLEEKLAAKEAECVSVSSKLSSSETQGKTLAEIREELKRSKLGADQMARSQRSLEMALREARTNSASLELKIAALEESQQELTSLKSAEMGTKTELSETHQKLAILQAEIQVLRQEKEEAATERKSLEEAKMQIESSLDSCEMRLASAEEKEKQHRSEKESAAQEIDSLKMTLADSKNQISGLQDKVYDNNRQELLLNNQIREKDQHCSDLRDQVASLSKRLLTLKERALEAEKRSSDLEPTCSELESKVAHLSKHVKALQNDHESSKEILEYDIEKLTKENRQIKDAKEKLVINLRTFETKSKELEEHLSRSQEIVQLGLEDTKSLKEELSRLKTSERKLREESSRVPVLEEAVAGLPALEATLTRTREQKQQALDAKAQLEENLKEAQAQIKDAEDSLARKEKVVQRLFAEKKSFMDEKKIFVNEKKSLEKQVREISDLKVNLDMLKSELEGKESDLQRAEKAHEHTASSLQQAEVNLEDLRASLSQKEDVIKSAFGENIAMAEDLSHLKSAEIQLQQATSKVTALEIGMEKMPVLEADVLRLKQQCQQAEEATQNVEQLLQESKAKVASVLQALSRKDKVVQRAFEEKNLESLARKAAEKDCEESKELVSQLETQLEQQKKEIDTLVALKGALESDLQSARNETQTMATLKDSLKAAQEKNEAHQRKIVEKEEEMTGAVLEKTELERKLHDLSLVVGEQRRSTEQVEAIQADLNRAEIARRDSLLANRNLETALSKAKASEKMLNSHLEKLAEDKESYVDEKKGMAQELIELKIAAAVTRKELNEAKSALEAVETREALGQENLITKDKRIQVLEAKIAELSQQTNEYAQTAAAADIKNEKHTKTNSDLGTTLTNLRTELVGLKKEKEAALATTEQTEKLLAEHRSDAETLQSTISTLRESLASRDLQIAELTQNLKEYGEKAEEHFEAAEMREMREALEAGFDLLKQEKDELVEAKKYLEDELSKTRSSLKASKDEATELEDANKSYLKALKNHDVVLKDLEELKKVKKTVEDKLEVKAAALTALEADFTRVKQDLGAKGHLEAELVEGKASCKSLSLKVAELEDKLATQSAETARFADDFACQKVEQETRLRKATEEVFAAKASAKEHDKQVISLQKERENDSSIRNDLEVELSEKQSALEALYEKMSELEASAELQQKEIFLAESEKSDTLLKVKSLEAQLEKANEELTSTQQNVADLEGANKSYLDALANQMAISNELDSLKETYTESRSQFENATKNIASLEQELSLAKEEKQSLESTKAIAEELLEAANNKLVALEKELDSTKQEQEKVSSESRSIGSDPQTLEKLNNDMQALRQKQESTAAERDTLSEELSEAQKKTRDLEQKIIDLENAGKSYLDALATQMSLSKELADLGNAKAETQVQLKTTVERLSILEENLESAKLLAQRQTEIAEVNSKAAKDAETKLSEKKKAHQETLDEIERHFKDLSDKVNVVTEKLQQKELQLEHLEKKTKDKDREQTSTIESLNQLLEEVRSANSDGVDRKVADLESLLQLKEGEIASLQSKVEETDQMNQQMQSLTEELKEQQELQEKANKSMQELVELVEEKSGKCSSLKAQVEKLKEELEGTSARQAQLESARRDQAAKEIEYNRLSAELTSLRDQVAIMELEGTENEESTSQEMERLKVELRDQREQSEKLSHLNREMQTTMGEADLLCNDLTSKLSTMNEECVRHQNTITQLQEDLGGRNDVSSAEMEKLRNELLAQKEACTKLSCTNQELEQVLEGKSTKCAELAEQMKSLENDAATRVERAADLEKSLMSTKESYTAEVSGLKKELSEHYAQQEKMKQSMTEMLALWEQKESQCSVFKEKLDELTSRLDERDAQVAKLQDEAAEYVRKLEELKQQNGSDEATKERLEEVTVALAEKEKKIVELASKLKEITTEHEKNEHEWEIKITQSESELESMKDMRRDEMLRIDEEVDEDGNVELQESKLTNRLENLTSKISEGEKQLADLEREFKEKWEQSEVAAQTQRRGKTKKGKVKLLSRFRR